MYKVKRAVNIIASVVNGMLLIMVVTIICILSSCRVKTSPVTFSSNAIEEVMNEVTSVMVHDITNPPLASRFYSYICLAGYETLFTSGSQLQNLHEKLSGFDKVLPAGKIIGSDTHFAALIAMLETARKLQPSGYLLKAYEERLIDSCIDLGMDRRMIDVSIKIAADVSGIIIKYAAMDGYSKTVSYSRYRPLRGDAYWYPTPPGFFPAVEPYFGTVRPFYLDSGSQFRPDLPEVFNARKGSRFFKLAEAVFSEAKFNSNQHQQIASFWDCNPFALSNSGHLMVGLKKISPAGHWMGIVGIACKKMKVGFNETMRIYTEVSTAMMDGFISCWDEKFRSNRVRPETFIRKYIDADWQPFLQTPPFPEFPSGHSVISAVAASILTAHFGRSFMYTDDVEVRYGLKARLFPSFDSAANEAAISRFYGGIHFPDGVNIGVDQGRKIGAFVLERLK